MGIYNFLGTICKKFAAFSLFVRKKNHNLDSTPRKKYGKKLKSGLNATNNNGLCCATDPGRSNTLGRYQVQIVLQPNILNIYWRHLKYMSTSLSHDKTRFRKQSLGYSTTEAFTTSCFGYSEGRMFKVGLTSDSIFCIL